MKITGVLLIIISLGTLVWAMHELSVGGQFDLESTYGLALLFPPVALMILLPLILPLAGIVIGVLLLINEKRQ